MVRYPRSFTTPLRIFSGDGLRILIGMRRLAAERAAGENRICGGGADKA